jgi:nucleoside phosphorylase
MRSVSLAQCRAAVREVRGAPHGARALDQVRPRGSFGITRSRPPVALVLYLAAREGRLVWQGPDAFALLERPLARAGPRSGHLTLSLLRLLDRYWELLLLSVPSALALLCAVALIPFRPLWTVAVVLCLLVLLYVAGLMTAFVARAVLHGARGSTAIRDPDRAGAEWLPSEHWSTPLCHHPDPDRAEEFLRTVSARLHRIILGEVAAATARLGARARAVEVTETLVCLLRGVTTDELAGAVVRASVEGRAGIGEVALLASLGRREGPDERPVDTGSFLFWYVGGAATVLLIEAYLVARWEAAACAPDRCAGHPATYLSALRWLAQRLLLNDPPGLSPVTWSASVIGWLTSLVSLTGVLVAVAALVQHLRARSTAVRRFQQMIDDLHERARVLILVAADVERDAVLSAAQRANRHPPNKQFVEHHTVFDLGVIGGAQVLLAQCGQGSISPDGSTLTAYSLIERLVPDYLILTGICYGLRRLDQEIADIVVASQLRVLDYKKVVDAVRPEGSTGGATTREIPRGDRVAPSTLLLNRFRDATAGWTGAKVHRGPVLSINTLLNSALYRARLIDVDDEAIGGEMEGAGVYAASARKRVDWILVKAISDWGLDKTDRDQVRAATSAAEFVIHTIAGNGLTERRQPIRR